MYKHEILGKKLVISNKAYDSLTRKWRVEKIREDKVHGMGVIYIRGECPYCGKYKDVLECASACPFSKFETKRFGCMEILESLLDMRNYPYAVDINIARWENREKAIACVSAVEKELRKFKKVK